jgi:hypothetical protein
MDRLDLRTNATRMRELLDHIVAREGSIMYFYCDHRSLVTIGIGHLVDRDRATLVERQRIAQGFAATQGVEMRHKVTNALATADQIVEDWERARSYGATHTGSANLYAGQTLYRITDATARVLLRTRVDGFIEDLYRSRTFSIYLDERIQMALVDARFNPAGVALYRDTPGTNYHADIPKMWKALDPESLDHDYDLALKLFEGIWKKRGTSYYQQRHKLRVAMFREGVAAMKAKEDGDYSQLIANLAVRGRP